MRVAPVGKPVVFQVRLSWSLSLAWTVNCNGCPTTATLLPMKLIFGGAFGTFTETTKSVEVELTAAGSPPPLSVAVKLKRRLLSNYLIQQLKRPVIPMFLV